MSKLPVINSRIGIESSLILVYQNGNEDRMGTEINITFHSAAIWYKAGVQVSDMDENIL